MARKVVRKRRVKEYTYGCCAYPFYFQQHYRHNN